MRPELEERLDHIADSIDELTRQLIGCDLDAFQANRFLQWGAERGIEVISEASRHIPEELKAKYPEVQWRQIADIGNRLRHAYHSVDTLIIWKIVQDHLSPLRDVIAKMRDDLRKAEANRESDK